MSPARFSLAIPAFAALALLSQPARAVETPSHLDLYYVAKADYEIEDFKFDDGSGYGAKGRFMILDDLFIAGEYQNNEYDPFDSDNGLFGGGTRVDVEIESYRGGLGLYFADSPFYVLGEYIGYETQFSTKGSENNEESIGEDADGSGYGAHAGIDGQFGGGLGLHAQAGYVDIGDAGDGFEFLVGAGFSFTPGLGVFADYRRTELEDGNVDSTLEDIRVGLRLSF